MNDIKMSKRCKYLLEEEFKKKYFKKIIEFINKEYLEKICYPKKNNIFKAFELTCFDKLKVVILGQDPYHGEGEAMGLSFSIFEGMNVKKYPPSLRNILKELKDDLGINKHSGDLTSWAEQGVFLLNSVLTVEKDIADSHKGIGWETFTDNVIELISKNKQNVVFILWGSKAHKKINLIDNSKHLIIKSSHPSPLSSYRGFFGSKPFSRANDYLRLNNIENIDW